MISSVVRFYTVGNIVIVLSFLLIIIVVWLFSNRNTMKWVAGCLCAEIITFAIVKTIQNWAINYTFTMIACEIIPIILLTVFLSRHQTRGEKKIYSHEKEIKSLFTELGKLQNSKQQYEVLTIRYEKEIEVYKELASDYAEDNDKLKVLITAKERDKEKELEVLKYSIASLEADMKSVEEKLAEKQGNIAKIDMDNQRVKLQLQASIPIENSTIITKGKELDLYKDEIKEILIGVFHDALRSVSPDSRRGHVLEDIITANPLPGSRDKFKAELKQLLNTYRTMDSPCRRGLEKIGFKITEDGKHYKAVLRGDGRYTFTLPKTSSDHRAGKNIVSDISRRLF